MKAKVLVRVDRSAALDAIRTLDAFGEALLKHEAHWPKELKRKYKEARRELVRAAGSAANTYGLA